MQEAQARGASKVWGRNIQQDPPNFSSNKQKREKRRSAAQAKLTRPVQELARLVHTLLTLSNQPGQFLWSQQPLMHLRIIWSLLLM
jgi:hypothetical protein